VPAAEPGEPPATITAPRVTIFNRQRAYVMVRSEHDFVSGYDRSKDNAWVQKKDKFQTGIFVDISGATDDRQEIAVKLIADYDRGYQNYVPGAVTALPRASGLFAAAEYPAGDLQGDRSRLSSAE
jgi:hypothetical protein